MTSLPDERTAHTEAFKRELVDEALHRTPTGGFPELEQRHGLPPGILFDWVREFGPPPPPSPFSAEHIWIGTTDAGKDEFWAYFSHAEGYWDLEVEEIESAQQDVTGCGFCIDLGRRFLYDEDLLLPWWQPAPAPVQQVIAEVTLGSDAYDERIARACVERGITTANAAFAYADPSEQIRDPAKLYNGLTYLGLFPTEGVPG